MEKEARTLKIRSQHYSVGSSEKLPTIHRSIRTAEAEARKRTRHEDSNVTLDRVYRDRWGWHYEALLVPVR
jgi:hypothetical protein